MVLEAGATMRTETSVHFTSFSNYILHPWAVDLRSMSPEPQRRARPSLSTGTIITIPRFRVLAHQSGAASFVFLEVTNLSLLGLVERRNVLSGPAYEHYRLESEGEKSSA